LLKVSKFEAYDITIVEASQYYWHVIESPLTPADGIPTSDGTLNVK
jgi:hypothetical protein